MDMQPKLENGDKAPDFTLTDLNGDQQSLADYTGKIVILNFWSAECRWSSRADELILKSLQKWGDTVQYLPIASNVNETRELINAEAQARNISGLLLDEDHQVADLYGATTTPHIFVIDSEGILRYQGALDDVTFRQRTPTINYLERAVEAIQNNKSPEPAITPSYGCTVVRVAP
ncbi:MAG: redoxin domain-containing protein [Anaerolineales bacterium]